MSLYAAIRSAQGLFLPNVKVLPKAMSRIVLKREVLLVTRDSETEDRSLSWQQFGEDKNEQFQIPWTALKLVKSLH
jgi:hypothetical protein